MLQEFNKTFEVEGPLKLVELENAIIEKYGSIQYFKHKAFKDVSRFGTTSYPKRYTCGTDFEWGDNNISINYSNIYNTREEALMGLLMDNKRKFRKLVTDVYIK